MAYNEAHPPVLSSQDLPSMSSTPVPDPRLERRVRRDGLCMAPSRESTMTPVERPFPATHARNQRLSSQEPNEEVERDPPTEDINLPANMEEEN